MTDEHGLTPEQYLVNLNAPHFDDGPIHALMTFPTRAGLLEAARLSTSWIKLSDADAQRALDAGDLWQHCITYGLDEVRGSSLPTSTQMEAEGWQVCAAWMTGRPDEHEPYLIWRRVKRPSQPDSAAAPRR